MQVESLSAYGAFTRGRFAPPSRTGVLSSEATLTDRLGHAEEFHFVIPARDRANLHFLLLGPVPDWLPSVRARLEALLTLAPNWDSYGARPVDPNCAGHLVVLLCANLLPGRPAPQIVPTPAGGLQVEWHCGGVDIEIEVSPGGGIRADLEDLHTGETEELELPSPATDARLKDWISRTLRPRK